jgi:hypothetical protein
MLMPDRAEIVFGHNLIRALPGFTSAVSASFSSVASAMPITLRPSASSRTATPA